MCWTRGGWTTNRRIHVVAVGIHHFGYTELHYFHTTGKAGAASQCVSRESNVRKKKPKGKPTYCNKGCTRPLSALAQLPATRFLPRADKDM